MTSDGKPVTEAGLAERLKVQGEIIDCLNRFHAIETQMWGKPLEVLIVRTVVQGQLEGRPYDLSALSGVLDLPMTTVHRKVGELVDAGCLVRRRRGKSVYLEPTDQACASLDQFLTAMLETLDRFYREGLGFDPHSREAFPVLKEEDRSRV